MKALAALAKIKADMTRQRHLFDLTRDDLGRKLCKAATDGVQASIAAEQTPDGKRWPELSDAYAEWKAFQFPGEPMAVLRQVMADPNEVAGEVAVARDHAVVTYGKTDQARQEATWFQETRRFWGFTDDSRKEVKAILDQRFGTI